MKFLLFLIFIIVIVGGGFFLLSSYNQKIASLHRDNILLKKQLSKLNTQYKQLINSTDNFTIEFLNFNNQYGIIQNGTTVYLSPYKNSIILLKISIAMEVGILEKALIDHDYWYYVALPVDGNINSRGWVMESSFLSFSSSSTKVVSKQ